jgi:hypothetical protein
MMLALDTTPAQCCEMPPGCAAGLMPTHQVIGLDAVLLGVEFAVEPENWLLLQCKQIRVNLGLQCKLLSCKAEH